MTVANQTDVLSNAGIYFDMASGGETVSVPWGEEANVVILSEKEYRELEKARNNLAYLEKLERSDWQVKTGHIVVKTMEELEAMAK